MEQPPLPFLGFTICWLHTVMSNIKKKGPLYPLPPLFVDLFVQCHTSPLHTGRKDLHLCLLD